MMSQLFTPFTLRGVTFKNRIVVSPMSQYRAVDGYANDWHLVHLGRFALGGAGLVFAEATAVTADGRRTPGDLGLWHDDHIEPLRRAAQFISAEGAMPGIQLGHAGRKASERRPWHTEGPLDNEDVRERGEEPWQTSAPSAIAYADDWPVPNEMAEADIARVIDAFGQAARRSADAGFKALEVYAAHGFLVHQFLSPIANTRTDRWGGSIDARARFAVAVAQAIRSHWPDNLPLIFRLSATDWIEGGITPDDTVRTARLLAAAGVDMIDCSSGGIGGRERPAAMKINHGFQVPFAAQVKRETGLPTMAVGFLSDVKACEAVIAAGDADLVALATKLLDDPNWPLRGARTLDADKNHSLWHPEFGWWLERRKKLLKKLGLR